MLIQPHNPKINTKIVELFPIFLKEINMFLKCIILHTKLYCLWFNISSSNSLHNFLRTMFYLWFLVLLTIIMEKIVFLIYYSKNPIVCSEEEKVEVEVPKKKRGRKKKIKDPPPAIPEEEELTDLQKVFR